MNSFFESKLFYIILLATILGEFLLPWILGHFYKDYDGRTTVMSALGSPESPVRVIYNVWLVWLGVFLLAASFALYREIRTVSVGLSLMTLVSVCVFAIGAGILAGLFSVNESKDKVTVASRIHGVGSALGFMTLLFFPLLQGIYGFMSGRMIKGAVCVTAFVLALLFFVFFIMGDKERFQKTVFAYEGLWERLSLFFMYVPFLYLSVENLI